MYYYICYISNFIHTIINKNILSMSTILERIKIQYKRKKYKEVRILIK